MSNPITNRFHHLIFIVEDIVVCSEMRRREEIIVVDGEPDPPLCYWLCQIAVKPFAEGYRKHASRGIIHEAIESNAPNLDQLEVRKVPGDLLQTSLLVRRLVQGID